MTSDSKRQRDPRGRQTPARAGQTASRAPRGHRGPMGLDSEQSARLLLFGATAVVLIAAAAFLAIGYYVSVIQPRGRTVLEVDGIKVSYAAMKRRMAHEYYTNTTYQDQQTIEFVPLIAYGNLVEELTLITKGEAAYSLTIDTAKIEEQERIAAGVGPTADAATLASAYRQALSDSRLTDDEFRRKIRAAAIEAAIRAKITETTPATVEQSKVELIAAETAEKAQQAIDRVRAGEAWAAVAAELSTDPTATETGGVKDYAFQGRSPAAYDSFAFTAPVGEISAPLQDPSGGGAFYVVRVVDRSQQPLTDGQKGPYTDEQYEKWLADTQATMTIVDKWSGDQEAQVDAATPLINHLREKLRREAEEQAQPPPTIDPGAAATAAAGGTAAAETQVASGTPLPGSPTQPAAEATPVATGTANGQ